MRTISCLLIAFLLFSFACSGNKKVQQQIDARTARAADLNSANRLLSLKRCVDAIAAYNKILEKNADDAGAWDLLGLAYLCNSNTDQALDAFNHALQLSPTYTDVHNNLGVCYMELKNYDKAREEFMKALQDENYPKSGPYFNLARLAYIQKSYEESRALARKSLMLAPKEAGPRLMYAMSLEQLGETEDAVDAYREVLRFNPNNVEAGFRLGVILLARGQPCEAREYFKRVIDADPLSDFGRQAIEMIKTVQCPK